MIHIAVSIATSDIAPFAYPLMQAIIKISIPTPIIKPSLPSKNSFLFLLFCLFFKSSSSSPSLRFSIFQPFNYTKSTPNESYSSRILSPAQNPRSCPSSKFARREVADFRKFYASSQSSFARLSRPLRVRRYS